MFWEIFTTIQPDDEHKKFTWLHFVEFRRYVSKHNLVYCEEIEHVASVHEYLRNLCRSKLLLVSWNVVLFNQNNHPSFILLQFLNFFYFWTWRYLTLKYPCLIPNRLKKGIQVRRLASITCRTRLEKYGE